MKRKFIIVIFILLFIGWAISHTEIIPVKQHLIDLPEEIQAAKVGDSMVLYKQDTVYFLWFYHHGDILPKGAQLVIVR